MKTNIYKLESAASALISDKGVYEKTKQIVDELRNLEPDSEFMHLFSCTLSRLTLEALQLDVGLEGYDELSFTLSLCPLLRLKRREPKDGMGYLVRVDAVEPLRATRVQSTLLDLVIEAIDYAYEHTSSYSLGVEKNRADFNRRVDSLRELLLKKEPLLKEDAE